MEKIKSALNSDSVYINTPYFPRVEKLYVQWFLERKIVFLLFSLFI